jgi:hypothetical protein
VATCVLSIVWGGFCFGRLIRYRRTSTALRYAIPTTNILWINAFLAEIPDGSRWTFERSGAHVLNYCTANPGRTVADGVTDLWGRVTDGQPPG